MVVCLEQGGVEVELQALQTIRASVPSHAPRTIPGPLRVQSGDWSLGLQKRGSAPSAGHHTESRAARGSGWPESSIVRSLYSLIGLVFRTLR